MLKKMTENNKDILLTDKKEQNQTNESDKTNEINEINEINERKLLVEELVEYAKKFLYLDSRDEVYIKNRLLSELKLGSPLKEKIDLSYISKMSVPDILIEKLAKIARDDGFTPEGLEELFTTKIMGDLSPLPSAVTDRFYALKEKEGIEKACEYLYNLSIMNNYVQKTAIGRNLIWRYDDKEKNRYIEITVNLSKPEKDNKQIAKLITAPQADKYPACQLCKENVGFEGHATHPARENLRTVPLTLGGESWFVQYSPYGYYNEHMIAISDNHTPMKIDGSTIDKLLDFTDFFPNYMVGSNAALPIVGGSILNHEHFQGGKYTFAMEKAKIETHFTIKCFEDITAGIVKWPMSVIRLSSNNRQKLALCCENVLTAWRSYSDPAANIYANTDNTPHNTITPIARKNGDMYECDLVLRNNITTPDRPLGLFHPNPTLHHIKKENIGLIEVMGLAVLPARLAKSITAIKDALLSGKNLADIESLAQHAAWAQQVITDHPEFCEENAIDILKQEIGKVFLQVLIDAGVFKRDTNGQAAFMRFVNYLNK